MTLPINIGKAGAIPRPVADIRADLIARVAATNPGYTANLPGSMIDDVAGTDVAAIALAEQAFVELINSLTPYSANDYLLTQFGKIQGIKPAAQTNVTVNMLFNGVAGYIVAAGFVVSDGNYTFTAINSGVIGSGQTILFEADDDGDFAVAPNTVTQILTSVDDSFGVTCTNPAASNPATAAQTSDSFRAQMLQANKASAVGMPTFIKTMVGRCAGVPPRGVAVKQVAGYGWQVIVIGGNPYDVALAIFRSCSDVQRLVGSTIDGSRTASVTLYDDPDQYLIPYVVSPGQSVSVQIAWGTQLPNFAGRDAVARTARQPIADYINSIPAGQPINLNEISRVFLDAIALLIPSRNVTQLSVSVAINGVAVQAIGNTSIISGDPEGFFATDGAGAQITIGQS